MSDALFVTTEWLARRLGDPGLALVDGSWHLPGAGRDAGAEFLEAHIPGAVFLDIDMPGLTAAHFARWLAVLEATVDAHHAGPAADEMKAIGDRIAYAMQLRLGLTPGALPG